MRASTYEPGQDEKITRLLENILKQQVGDNIPKAEMALIIAYAKDILISNEENSNKILQKLNLKDCRDELAAVLVAATAAAMKFEMQLLQKECQHLLLKLQDPALDPKEKERLAPQLKKALSKLNKFNPDKESQRKMEELLKNPAFLDALLPKKEKNLTKKSPEVKPSEQPEEDKELIQTLRNLYGMDPTKLGAMTYPVLTVVGNFMGIADFSPAESSAEPLHRLSGDFTNEGTDEHLPSTAKQIKAQLEAAADDILDICGISDGVNNENGLDDAIYAANKSSPKLTPH
jgi:hypothetical protein